MTGSGVFPAERTNENRSSGKNLEIVFLDNFLSINFWYFFEKINFRIEYF